MRSEFLNLVIGCHPSTMMPQDAAEMGPQQSDPLPNIRLASLSLAPSRLAYLVLCFP